MDSPKLVVFLGLVFTLGPNPGSGQGFVFPDQVEEIKTSDDFTDAEGRGVCTTISGPSEGLPCVFPFKFQEFTFEGCTTITDPEKRPWCSTKVDDAMNHITGEGHWAHCDPSTCPIIPEEELGEDYTNLEEEYDEGTTQPVQDDQPRSATTFRDCNTVDGQLGICEPAVLCAGITDEEAANNVCELEIGNPDEFGVCCQLRVENDVQIAFSQEEEKTVEVDNVSVNDINEFVSERFLADSPFVPQSAPAPSDLGVDFSFGDQFEGEESQSTDDGDINENDDPTEFHLRFNAPTDDALDVDQKANTFLRTTDTIQSEKNLTPEQAGIGLRMFGADTSSAIDDICPWTPSPICDPTANYRTFDGTCNNLKETNYGRAVTPFQRILLPEYSGRLHLPRTSVVGGQPLPSARRVSLATTETSNALDSEHTVLVMQMGQFIDHDLTHTPNHGQNCCGQGGTFPSSFDTERCFPIEMDANDPFWKGSKTCMSMARSLASPGLKCSLEFRQQMNQITHWLDGSNIYGSSEAAADQLRQRFGGRLQITRQTGSRVGILPSCSSGSSTTSTVGMCRGCSSCFFTGDGRANEQLNLLVIHTLFMREHNRIAQFLQKLNPFWSDDKIYQEARKINVAQYQHIVYKEWLPIIIGRSFMDQFGLWPLSKGYSDTYMDTFDPRITNEFATAAFRFGHSLIPSSFKRIQRTRSNNGFTTSMNLREVFFKPNEMKKSSGMIDDLLRGLTSQEGELWDNAFSPDIQDHLFESGLNRGGLDLVSLNIQRGRDHGLPGYNAYRAICDVGSGRVTDWSGFEDSISPVQVAKLRQIYQHVDDVDLFVGGYLETKDPEALLGPTFKCIIGDQFARLKLGDRFFYDLNHPTNVGFTPDQLQEIRKTSLARIICDNADTIRSIQPQVMKLPGSSSSNDIVSCNSIQIPSMSLSVFRDKSFGRR